MAASGLTAAQQDQLNSHEPVFAVNRDLAAALATRADVDGHGILVVSKTIGEADLTAAATSQSINLTAAPLVNVIPIGAFVDLTTAFGGGGAASCTVELGDAGDSDRMAAAVNIFTGQAAGKKDGVQTAFNGFRASYAPQATFTANVNVTLLTTGSLTAYFFYRQV